MKLSMVDFSMTDGKSPVKFTTDGYQLVVMPMLTAESKPKAEAEAEAKPEDTAAEPEAEADTEAEDTEEAEVTERKPRLPRGSRSVAVRGKK
jgi:hypothetical protein